MKRTAVVSTLFCQGVKCGQNKGCRERLYALGVLLAELQDSCCGVGGFGVVGRLARRELERVECGRVVRAETEEAGNGFGPEAGGRLETCGLDRLREELGAVGEPECARRASRRVRRS